MGNSASNCISKIIRPCSILVGKLFISKKYQPGDFILSHIDKRPTNLFLGGAPYTHLGILTKDDFVIDMVSKGATKTKIEDWITGKDRILILRVNTLPWEEREKLSFYAEGIYDAKTPYDFSFEIGSDAIYCTELAYLALRSLDHELPVKLGLTPTIGGLLQSTTFRANSFIKSLEHKKIIPLLEWRYGEDISEGKNVNIERLLDNTLSPEEATEKSNVLYELTKLAYPFNKDRLELIRKNEAIPKGCCPGAKLRSNRDKYNRHPHGDLKEMKVDIDFKVFRDTVTREVYVVFPQTSNLLHCPCKWSKLVSFDAVHGFPEALGSVEILVPNNVVSGNTIPKDVIKQGSYNYRDSYVAGKYDHCCFDVFGCCK